MTRRDKLAKLKAEAQIKCDHGLRHIRTTNMPQAQLRPRKDGSYSATYCRKCEPDMGLWYDIVREKAAELAAERTRGEKDKQQVSIPNEERDELAEAFAKGG